MTRALTLSILLATLVVLPTAARQKPAARFPDLASFAGFRYGDTEFDVRRRLGDPEESRLFLSTYRYLEYCGGDLRFGIFAQTGKIGIVDVRSQKAFDALEA